MTQDQLLILLLRIILISGEVTTLAFVVQYTRLAPWWRTPIGRRVVIIDLLLAGALIPSILSLFFNFSRLTSHIAAWVDVVLLGLVTPVMLYGIWVWEKIHRHGGEWSSGGHMKRALTPSLNPTGLGSAAAAIYAAVVMIWNATHHQGVIDPQVIVAALSAAAFLYARFKVTPVADPKDGNGQPLRPAPPVPVITLPTAAPAPQPITPTPGSQP